MLYPFGACVLKASSPAPQYHIYSWQLASFILPVQVFYRLKNKQENTPKPNQPKTNQIQTSLNINGENEGARSVGPLQALVSESSHCVCRGLQTDWLSALIATAFAFPPSAADLLQCFFIR